MNRDYYHLAAASPEDTDKELAQTYTQIVSSLDTHIAALQRERDAVQQDAERSLLHGATETTPLQPGADGVQRGSVGGGRNRTVLFEPEPEPEPEPKPETDKVVELAKAYRVVSGLADIGRFV